MRYKRMNKNDIYQILKRWHSGQKIKRIALVEGRDRKTIRYYLSPLAAKGISRDDPLPEKGLFFNMISEMYERSSVIITSNKGFDDWAEMMGDEVMTVAMLDRLLHHSRVFNLSGKSFRIQKEKEE